MTPRGGSTLVEPFRRFRGSSRVALEWVGALCSLAGAVGVLGCGASAHRLELPAAQLLDQSGPGHRLRAIAWSGGGPILAMNRPAPAGAGRLDGAGSLEAPGRWTLRLQGDAGPMAATEARGLATEQATPGLAAAVWFDATTGRAGPRIPVLATEFVTIADVASCAEGAVLAGSFGGTLRVGERVVSTGGQRDGFFATLDLAGHVTALERMGGDGDDGFTAAACRGGLVAVAGTFSDGAELRGVELQRVSSTSKAADAVLVLLRDGQLAWQRSFGGSREDLPVDLAITARDELAVVGMARGEFVVGEQTLEVRGSADGYLARWSAAGRALGAIRIGGDDYDALTRVAALGDRLMIAGFFSGSIDLDGAVLTARGGDDALLISVDRDGHLRPIAVSGDGREEIVGLAPAAQGLALGVVHTAGVEAFGVRATAPADPLGGAAVVVAPSL